MTTSNPANRQPKRQARPAPPKKGNSWLWAIPLFVAAIVAVIVLAVTNHGPTPVGPKGIGDPVPADILKAVTQVPQTAFDAVSPSSATPPEAVPPTDKSTGKPVFLYMGAEYCPYCAAERWPMVIALSRFGQFTGLKITASSATDTPANIPTFTFSNASYTSQYIDFQSVETQGRDPVNGSYPTLQTPNANQDALFTKYDTAPYTQSAGAIPFVLVGESYLWVGSQYQPPLLQGMVWSDVATSLNQPASDPGKSILANADMLTATICQIDGAQPSQVCTSPGVVAASKLVPPQKTS